MAPERRARRTPSNSSWDYVHAIQRGNAEAFAQIYLRYRRDVFTYVLAGTKAVAIAEDLTSETFLRALRRIGTVREQADDVRAWIMTIARNLVYDHHNSARTRREIVCDRVDPLQVVDSAEQTALRNQLRADFVDALGRLTDLQRECLFLRFYCGLSVARTAEALDRNPAAVRALQYRAIRELATTCGEALP